MTNLPKTLAPGLALALVCGLAPFVARAETQKLVAVLPLSDPGGTVDKLARDTIEETIRTVGGDLLRPRGYVVLTGENTLRLLADNGVDSNKACESECALEAARELKAHLFISGSASKLEGGLVVFVRIYDAQRGVQLGSLKLEADLVKGIRAAFEERAAGFFDKALSELSGPVAVNPPPGPAEVMATGSGTWKVRFEPPDPKEPWALLDATLQPVCQSLPCALELAPALAYKLRRSAALRTDVVDVDVKVNLDALGFTRGQALKIGVTKDWGAAAITGYGVVGGAVLGASVVTGLVIALVAGWRPTDWFDSKGNYFWFPAGVGAGIAVVTGTVVTLVLNTLHAFVEADVK